MCLNTMILLTYYTITALLRVNVEEEDMYSVYYVVFPYMVG